MHSATRRKIRLWALVLTGAVLLVAFLAVRLHDRANNPQTAFSPNDTSTSAPQHHQKAKDKKHNRHKGASATTGAATGGSATVRMLQSATHGSSFTFGPGMHTYVSTVSGTGNPPDWVGYQSRGGQPYSENNPPDPFVRRARIEAPGVHVVIGGRVGPQGGSVTCTITVDGTTAVTRTVTGAYRMVVCSA